MRQKSRGLFPLLVSLFVFYSRLLHGCLFPWSSSPLFKKSFSPSALWLPLPNIPSPASKNFDDFGRDGRGNRNADENEGFMDRVGEGELGPNAFCVTKGKESVG